MAQGISILELHFVAFFIMGGLAMVLILLAAAACAPRTGRQSPPARTGDSCSASEAPQSASVKDRVEVVAYAGIGGFASFCVFQGLFGEHGLITHPNLKEIATLAVLLPLAVWIEVQFVHPRLDRHFEERGLSLHHPKLRFGRWDIRGTLTLVLIFTVLDLVQHFAHEDLAYMLASVGCGGVTGLWVCGAGTGRLRAPILGAVGGCAVGMIGVAAFFYLIHSGLIADPSLPAGNDLSPGEGREILLHELLAVLGGGLLCAASGAAGGILVAAFNRKGPEKKRTALAGALGGASVYVFITAAALAIGCVRFPAILPSSLADRGGGLSAADLRMVIISVMHMNLLGGGLYWAALGGVGGLCLDWSRARRPVLGLLWVFPAVKIVYSAAQLALGLGAQWILLGNEFLGTVSPKALLLDFGAGMAVLLGWGVGLTLCPTADTVLGARAGRGQGVPPP